ncbi:hypothetical protein [Acinetobacter tjernbergiae]|uniref:Uncharacterized protein n=1 Tax=Acinetobacter tjernbergiae DSM 14971 = CIP 107465 TaxID=1120928 RepID=V2V0E6_9GAMM|nr:hypothetical protein [Acinetobacter tjernbergiae]ESK54326.1 hypothetical protein F990_02784 [Acinetobacter tjernbergiae DSM 14971 = CIP 107465]
MTNDLHPSELCDYCGLNPSTVIYEPVEGVEDEICDECCKKQLSQN